jgi:hypothetical protein
MTNRVVTRVDADFDLRSWIVVRDNCRIKCSADHDDGTASITFGHFEMDITSTALRRLIESASATMRELDEQAAADECDCPADGHNGSCSVVTANDTSS